MDVVYPFVFNNENDSEELRYSLRSLTNILHDNVYVVGDQPIWLRNVTNIPVQQKGTKHQNIRANLLAVLSDERLSDDFIYMNDDFFIMKKLDGIPMLNYGDMKELIDRFHRLHPNGSTYITAMENTLALLRTRGIKKPLSYELHVPLLVNKHRLAKLLRSVDDPTIHFRSVYGNSNEAGGASIEDVKVFLDPLHNDLRYIDEPDRYLSDQRFLSVSGDAFKQGPAGTYIRDTFKAPSVYETVKT